MQAHQRVVQTKILEACYQSVDNAQRDYRAKFDNVESHLRIMTEKMLKMEETITTQAARIRSLEDENNSLRTNAPSLSTSGMGTGLSLSPLIEQQFSQQDRILASHDIKLAEHGLRIDMLDCKNTEGVLLWKITDIRRRRREAVSGKTPSIYSQPFYTSGCGYKLCARLYLNGDGMGKGTHLSLFFVVMRGEYDALLPWPFQQKVTLVLMDQTYGRHVSDTFRPDPTSSSFKKPRNEMNIAMITCSRPVRVSTVDEIRQYTSVNSLAVAKSACLLTRKSQLCSPGLLLGIINLKASWHLASTLEPNRGGEREKPNPLISYPANEITLSDF
ncbi:TNF receptor-associated factor 3-like [Oscarella lobularis]|uniref:TNF receptor-associated factor 3-like n=1 Tax=Oscarella lobularis TaxID=121494 RepID=UPI003314099A